MPEITLYQYEVCPFCCRVKAFLDYHGIPYKVVEVNPLTKGELKWSEYKKVPLVVYNGEPVPDSIAIVNRIKDDTGLGKQLPTSEEEAKWAQWVADWLVHTLPPNIYRTMGESLESFGYITEHGNFNWWQQASAKYAGAGIMFAISKRLKKRHNIENERQALYDAVNEWLGAVGERKFLAGNSEPGEADLAVFGTLRSIEGLTTFDDVMANTKLSGWYERMTAAVGPATRVE